MRTHTLIFSALRRRDGVDRPRIKKLLKARGLTYVNAAHACGKSYMAIRNKLEGYAPFTVEDIQCFYELLKLTSEEATAIFFGAAA